MFKTFFAYFSLVFSAFYVGFSLCLWDFWFVIWIGFFLGFFAFFQVLRWIFVRKFSLGQIIESSFRAGRILFSITGFILFILLFFSAYQSIYSPAKLSNITISNGKQEVQFLQMAHIATEDFYSEKTKQIEDLIKKDYHFLLEGVKQGSKESTKELKEYIGLEADTYSNLAQFLQIKNQEKSLYEIIPKEKAHAIDVSIDTVVNAFKENNAPKTQDEFDIGKLIQEMENIKNPYKKDFYRLSLLGMLNMVIKSQSQIASSLESDPTMKVILHDRNQPIIDYIKNHSDQKIATIYGGLHFQGVLSELKKSDKNWKIVSYTGFSPFVSKNFPKNLLQNLLSWELFIYSILTFLIFYFLRTYVKKNGQKTKNTKTPTGC